MATEAALGAPPWLLHTLEWIQLHPILAVWLLAVAAAVEGLFLIGMLIPGSLLMFAAGAIAVAGEIPLLPVLLVAALGAWLGDCASFYLGWRFRSHLPSIARRLHMPNAMQRGERFFARHGGKSILLGRFVGPLRPLVPAIAGAAAMRPGHFIIIDLIAALLWAPAYALPGVVIGATLSLASEVTGRFAILLGLGLAVIWSIWWLIIQTVRLGQTYAEPWLLRTMDWSHKHRRLGNLGPALADPDQPETPILAASLLGLAAIFWLLGQLWWQWPGSTPGPPAIDDAVYDALASLLNHISWPIVLQLDAIGTLPSSLLLGLGLLVLFAGLRHMRMAAHWVAGLLGGALLGLSLPGTGMAIGPNAMLSPTITTSLSLSLWFCLAGLLSTGRSANQRVSIYSLTGVLLSLILLARLMLGQISFSQTVLALPASLIWCSLLILGFRRHLRRPRKLPMAATMGLVLAIVGLCLLLYPADMADKDRVAWENAERSPARVNLHWLGPADEIKRSLREAGWQVLPATPGREYVAWLLPGQPSDLLPPAPHWLAGRPPDLRFIRRDENQDTLILRLWRDHDARWLGQVGELRIRHWAGLMQVPVTLRTEEAIRQMIRGQSTHWQVSRTRRQTTLYILSARPGE